jgi:hypothetical protein
MLLFLLSALAAEPTTELDPRLEQAVRTLQTRVSRIRGLPFLLPVEVSLEDPETIRANLLEEDLDDEARASLAEATLALRAFHLVDGGFDFETLYLDVMTESLGGYYDPEEDQLVLVRRDEVFSSEALDGASEEEQVAAHELVHALQDQHFDLQSIRNREYDDDDVDVAVTSLIEGDASFAMAWFAQPGMTPWLDTIDLGASDLLFHDATGSSALGRAPRPIYDSTLFPYTVGMEFAQRVVRERGWDGLDAAFATPPLSTEQILHPRRYLGPRPDWPTRLELPDLSATFGPGWSHVSTNTMGELAIRSVLHQHTVLERAMRAAAAEGWDGDRYGVYVHEDGTLAVVWATTWDSLNDANEFARVADQWVRTLNDDEPGRIGKSGTTWNTPSGHWAVLPDDRDVAVLLGVPPRRAKALHKALIDLPRWELRELDQLAPVTSDEEPPSDPTAPP